MQRVQSREAASRHTISGTSVPSVSGRDLALRLLSHRSRLDASQTAPRRRVRVASPAKAQPRTAAIKVWNRLSRTDLIALHKGASRGLKRNFLELLHTILRRSVLKEPPRCNRVCLPVLLPISSGSIATTLHAYGTSLWLSNRRFSLGLQCSSRHFTIPSDAGATAPQPVALNFYFKSTL